MILTCPACSTRYRLDPSRLGGDGRRVRCAKCAHTWFQKPLEDTAKPAEPSPLAAGPPPVPEGPEPSALARRRQARAAGWAGFAIVVLALAVGGVIARTEIVNAWPPAARLYQLVGLTVADLGLELREVTSRRAVEDGVPVLVVEGVIANISDRVRQVPPLKAALTDADQRELQHWTFTAGDRRLLPGEAVSFKTSLKNPAGGGARLSVVISIAP